MATTITIKNIPAVLYDLLKSSASSNHRSINNEVISVIEEKFRSKQISPDDFLASVRVLREKTKGHLLTDDFIDQAKNKGRP